MKNSSASEWSRPLLRSLRTKPSCEEDRVAGSGAVEGNFSHSIAERGETRYQIITYRKASVVSVYHDMEGEHLNVEWHRSFRSIGRQNGQCMPAHMINTQLHKRDGILKACI